MIDSRSATYCWKLERVVEGVPDTEVIQLSNIKVEAPSKYNLKNGKKSIRIQFTLSQQNQGIYSSKHVNQKLHFLAKFTKYRIPYLFEIDMITTAQFSFEHTSFEPEKNINYIPNLDATRLKPSKTYLNEEKQILSEPVSS